ncbi:hypothetical protein BBJ28_00013432 [Nothophytophthora sp. Chile5]|nr:hypothetical protein BBJ28_00013432 [Nothophytophthora sp. Chile5]
MRYALVETKRLRNPLHLNEVGCRHSIPPHNEAKARYLAEWNSARSPQSEAAPFEAEADRQPPQHSDMDRNGPSVGSDVPMAPGMSERFTSPFAPLALAPEAAAELEALAQAFVSRSIATYERFLLDDGSKVDESQWKFMYEKEDVRSYVERSGAASAGAGAAAGGAWDKRAAMYSDTPAAALPVILVVGTIVGDLDDTIYGFLCPTLDQMRVKTSYVKDNLVRGSVLASLVAPSEAQPFRSMTIKWMEKGQPVHVRAVIKNRDFVYMEATGVEYLRNGERVGYQLVHSVQFPETPARASAIRGNMSMCALYRQKDNQVTDVFIKGFLNPAGGLVRSIITRSAARALLSVSKNVYCSRMKKIMWAVRQRHRAASRDDSRGGLCLEDPTVDEPCVGCAKKPSASSSLLAAAASRMNYSAKHIRRRRRCKLCERYVCSDCRKLHKLTFILPDHRLMQHQIALCAGCQETALDVKAGNVARDEQSVGLLALFEWHDAYATSSGSELVMIDELN